MTGARQERWPGPAPCPVAPLRAGIRRSSSLCPDRRAATNHRGCLPRPDHVSNGADGLKYFGKTLGYLRLGRSAFCCSGRTGASPICSSRFNCARRCSSLRFSTRIFSARIFVSSSCRSQSSSKSIASRSNLRIVVSLLCSRLRIDRGRPLPSPIFGSEGEGK